MQKTSGKEKASVFQLNGIPSMRQAVPLAIQHVVAMIVGCVTPALIISSVAGLETADRVILVQAALVIAGLATFLQLFPIGKYLGSGLPVIMGVSFAYLPSLQAVAEGYDLASIFGAQIVGGIIAVIVGIFVKRIRYLFPPLITGTVVLPLACLCIPRRLITWLEVRAHRPMVSGRTGLLLL